MFMVSTSNLHGIIIRPKDWGTTSDNANALLSGMKDPRFAWRGMTSDEYDATVAMGKGVQSSGKYSLSVEGTQFSDNASDAEGYVNFGRDDPRRTGRPTYLVEVLREGLRKKPDGYLETLPGKGVPASSVTRVWRFTADADGNIIAEDVVPPRKATGMKSLLDLAVAKNLLSLAYHLVEGATAPFSNIKLMLRQFPDVAEAFKKLVIVWMGFDSEDYKLSDDEFLEKNETALTSTSQEWQPLLRWLVPQLKKSLDKPEYKECIDFLSKSGNIDVLSKYIKNKHIDTTGHSLDEMIKAALRHSDGVEVDLTEEKLIEQGELKMAAKKPPFQGPVVYTYADGWTIQDLNTKALLVDETVYMGDICVGKDTYGWPEKVLEKKSDKVYSIRKPDGWPVINISFYTSNNVVNEIVKYANDTRLSRDEANRVMEAHLNKVFVLNMLDGSNFDWIGGTDIGKKLSESPEFIDSLDKDAKGYSWLFTTASGNNWLDKNPAGIEFGKSDRFAKMISNMTPKMKQEGRPPAGLAWLFGYKGHGSGRFWLKTQQGMKFMESEDFKKLVSNTNSGQQWLQSINGINWMKDTMAGAAYSQSPDFIEHLGYDKDHLGILDGEFGNKWLNTKVGKEFSSGFIEDKLSTRRGNPQDVLESVLSEMMTNDVYDWWWKTPSGQEITRKPEFRNFLLREVLIRDTVLITGKNTIDWIFDNRRNPWLTTPVGKDFLKTREFLDALLKSPHNMHWLYATRDGSTWMHTPEGEAFSNSEEFASILDNPYGAYYLVSEQGTGWLNVTDVGKSFLKSGRLLELFFKVIDGFGDPHAGNYDYGDLLSKLQRWSTHMGAEVLKSMENMGQDVNDLRDKLSVKWS